MSCTTLSPDSIYLSNLRTFSALSQTHILIHCTHMSRVSRQLGKYSKILQYTLQYVQFIRKLSSECARGKFRKRSTETAINIFLTRIKSINKSQTNLHNPIDYAIGRKEFYLNLSRDNSLNRGCRIRFRLCVLIVLCIHVIIWITHTLGVLSVPCY